MRCENCGSQDAEPVLLTRTGSEEDERATLCLDCQFLMIDIRDVTDVRPQPRTGEGSDE